MIDMKRLLNAMKPNLKQVATIFFIIGFILAFMIRPYFIFEDTDDKANQVLHGTHEVNKTKPAPGLNVIVSPDSHSGWNIKVETVHFEFRPDKVGQEHVDGEGHAHLYVNGVKYARLYSSDFHLDNLEPGVHDIYVTLSTNDHKELTARGLKIFDQENIFIDEEGEERKHEH